MDQIVPNAKKILITTESHESFVLRVNSKDRAFGLCPSCGTNVEMLSLDQSVSTSRLRTGELVRLIEAKEIHAIETESGHLLVCGPSLASKARATEETGNEKRT